MSKKKKTVAILDKPQVNPDNNPKPISIDLYVRALENTLSLPLQENMNFHQIVILASEKTYKQSLMNSCIFFLKMPI